MTALSKALWVYIEEFTLDNSNDILLNPQEAHHLQHVLRGAEGTPLVAFDGLGHTCWGILQLNGHQALWHGTQKIELQPRPKPELSLIQVLPNDTSTFELLLKKACELGLHIFYPVIGDYTEKHRWTVELWARKQTRWQQILIGACKQAKNPYFPIIHPPTNFKNLPWDSLKNCFFGSLVSQVAQSFPKKDIEDTFVGIVGPEGGFSPNEENFLQTLAQPVRLSPYVLRVETAVVSLLTYLRNYK